jgi:peptidyl-prolyl cis-trans isomerase D
MLDFMRKRKQARVIQVLFLIIILVFIFWGFGGSQSDDAIANGVALVDGQPISVREFQRTYDNIKAAYREAYKDRLTAEMIQALNLKQQAVDQLVNSRLMQQEARRIGFTVDDDELRDSIRAISYFQVQNTFSQEQYQRVLSYLRMTPGEFEEGQRAELLRKKLERLMTDAVSASEAEALDLFRLANERINLSFVKITSTDLLNDVVVEKKEVEDYYNTHRESFREPERIRFAYVAYPATRFESNVQITAQEEEQFYNDHTADRFSTPAQVHARHILFSFSSPDVAAEEKAKLRETATAVLTRARAGEDFATLAKTYSQDTATAPNGGDLGLFPRGRMVKAFEEAAFNLSAGAISDIVETPFGLHIIKAEAVNAERVRPLDEVRVEIRQELTRERARDLAREHAIQDRNKIHSGSTLAEVAQSAGLAVVETPLVAREETLPELGRQPELTHTAMGLAIDQVSEPVQVEDAWYLVSPREKVESKIPDFAAIAEEVEKRVRGEKAEQLAKTKADALLAKAMEKKDLVAVATEAKLGVEETGTFARQGSYVPKIGNLPELKKEVFRLTPEAPIASQTYLWSGNAFIVMLKEKLPASTADFEKQKDRLREDLQKRKQAAVLENFLNSLKQQATITLNSETLLNLPS